MGQYIHFYDPCRVHTHTCIVSQNGITPSHTLNLLFSKKKQNLLYSCHPEKVKAQNLLRYHSWF